MTPFELGMLGHKRLAEKRAFDLSSVKQNVVDKVPEPIKRVYDMRQGVQEKVRRNLPDADQIDTFRAEAANSPALDLLDTSYAGVSPARVLTDTAQYGATRLGNPIRQSAPAVRQGARVARQGYQYLKPTLGATWGAMKMMGSGVKAIPTIATFGARQAYMKSAPHVIAAAKAAVPYLASAGAALGGTAKATGGALAAAGKAALPLAAKAVPIAAAGAAGYGAGRLIDRASGGRITDAVAKHVFQPITDRLAGL